jgi:fused signal recognition particle receptor
MVFNWFRRKFDEGATPADGVVEATPADNVASETGTDASPSEPESTESTESADNADVSATDETATPNSDVYLEWAKAAFQNIQQRQTPATVVTDVTDVTDVSEEAIETTDPATDPAADLAADPAADLATETPDLSNVETGETDTANIPIEDAPEPTPIAETEPIATNIEPAQPAESTADEPIASSDDVPEPIAPVVDSVVTPATPAPEPEKPSTPAWMRAAAERQARLDRLQETAIEASDAFEQLPDRGGVSGELELDEDFIWSAEVLAAQGRSADDIAVEEIEWLTKLRSGLGKTRLGLVNQLKSIVGQGPLNEDAVTEIEALLLQADVGVDATDAIIEALQAKMREETLPPDKAIAYLKQVLREMLEQPFERQYDRDFSPVPGMLNIWMMTGVNGAGKTTTIGKLTHLAKSSGYDCLIAAADTFRAAAVEQVKVWGERTQTEVIANPGQNTDPASVVFDAIEAAKARNVNLLLVDTAGRLQNKKNLMDELSKMRRIITTKAPNARIESLLVLDATLGQNGLRQAEVFAEAAQLSGVVLTKLDGSARGGVALAVVRQLGLPIRFIGAGEGIEDLRPFSSYEFVEALLDG